MSSIKINLGAELGKKLGKGILSKVWAKKNKRKSCWKFWNGAWWSMAMIIKIKAISSIFHKIIILAS